MMQKIWETIGGKDCEAKRSARDPILFPGNTLENPLIMSHIGGLKSISVNSSVRFTGKADASLLSKMPPTIIWESEFDQYLTPTTRYTVFFSTRPSKNFLTLTNGCSLNICLDFYAPFLREISLRLGSLIQAYECKSIHELRNE